MQLIKGERGHPVHLALRTTSKNKFSAKKDKLIPGHDVSEVCHDLQICQWRQGVDVLGTWDVILMISSIGRLGRIDNLKKAQK